MEEIHFIFFHPHLGQSMVWKLLLIKFSVWWFINHYNMTKYMGRLYVFWDEILLEYPWNFVYMVPPSNKWNLSLRGVFNLEKMNIIQLTMLLPKWISMNFISITAPRENNFPLRHNMNFQYVYVSLWVGNCISQYQMFSNWMSISFYSPIQFRNTTDF